MPLAALALLAPYLPMHDLTTLALPAPTTLALLAVGQIFALSRRPALADLLALVPAILLSRPRPVGQTPGLKGWVFPRPAATNYASTSSRWSLHTPLALLPPTWRPHLLTIIRTPASRRIFGFLCLNLAYMGVQMGYGIATNSLGLISDGELCSKPAGKLKTTS